jgi:hypothetical protein
MTRIQTHTINVQTTDGRIRIDYRMTHEADERALLLVTSMKGLTAKTLNKLQVSFHSHTHATHTHAATTATAAAHVSAKDEIQQKLQDAEAETVASSAGLSRTQRWGWWQKGRRNDGWRRGSHWRGWSRALRSDRRRGGTLWSRRIGGWSHWRRRGCHWGGCISRRCHRGGHVRRRSSRSGWGRWRLGGRWGRRRDWSTRCYGRIRSCSIASWSTWSRSITSGSHGSRHGGTRSRSIACGRSRWGRGIVSGIVSGVHLQKATWPLKRMTISCATTQDKRRQQGRNQDFHRRIYFSKLWTSFYV